MLNFSAQSKRKFIPAQGHLCHLELRPSDCLGAVKQVFET